MYPITRNAALILALLATLSTGAHAERADRSKPVVITSERGTADDLNKVLVYTGRVTLTQGTLVVTGDKLTVTQDAEGFQKGVAVGGKDGLARFRQKKEGKDEYIEGEAERIEYDGRTDKTKLFGRAVSRSGQNETRGQYIEYDSYTEQFEVTNGPNATIKKGDEGLITTTLMPKQRPDKPAAAKP